MTQYELDQFIKQLLNASNVEEVEAIEYIAHPFVRIHIDELKEKVKRYLSVQIRKNRI